MTQEQSKMWFKKLNDTLLLSSLSLSASPKAMRRVCVLHVCLCVCV